VSVLPAHSVTARELGPSALDPLAHSSFSFYDFMPGAGFRVAQAPAAHEAGARIASRMHSRRSC
jgi:hypothetical protein